MALAGDENVNASLRDLFAVQKELGRLENGYSFLREVTENNRKEGLSAIEKLSIRIDAGLGSVRAELLDELRQQERRHIDTLKGLEERFASSIDKLTSSVEKAFERATIANTGVAVVSAHDSASTRDAEAKLKLEQVRAPVTQTLYRWAGIIALAVIAGREGMAAMAQVAAKFG